MALLLFRGETVMYERKTGQRPSNVERRCEESASVRAGSGVPAPLDEDESRPAPQRDDAPEEEAGYGYGV
jgi:hypothetical protein